MSLNSCPVGKEVTIIDCAADAMLRRRLSTMGIAPGAKVTLLRASFGNLVLSIYDGRLAIDRGLAKHIIVA